MSKAASFVNDNGELLCLLKILLEFIVDLAVCEEQVEGASQVSGTIKRLPLADIELKAERPSSRRWNDKLIDFVSESRKFKHSCVRPTPVRGWTHSCGRISRGYLRELAGIVIPNDLTGFNGSSVQLSFGKYGQIVWWKKISRLKMIEGHLVCTGCFPPNVLPCELSKSSTRDIRQQTETLTSTERRLR